MAAIELQSLSKETIDKMGFNNHDLWLVKIENETYGPFESQALKEYASQNETLFDEALASRLDTNNFQAFWSHAFFQRRGPQVIKSEPHAGSFWLLHEGQKKGPFSFKEIDKKLEMNLLTMVDHISTDDGHHWKKIYEVSGFDRRTHTAAELPEAPFESSFQKARLALIDKIERPHVNTQDEVAELAHQGSAKVLTLKLDEMTLQNLKSTEVSESLKWAVPGAAAIIMTIVASGYFIMSPSSPDTLVENEATREEIQRSAPNPSANMAAAQGSMPRPSMPTPTREPASFGNTQAPQRPHESRFPTHMETHSDPERDEPMDRDFMDPVNEPEPQEQSLVSRPQQDDQSLDAAMNGEVRPVEPIVEESSDF